MQYHKKLTSREWFLTSDIGQRPHQVPCFPRPLSSTLFFPPCFTFFSMLIHLLPPPNPDLTQLETSPQVPGSLSHPDIIPRLGHESSFLPKKLHCRFRNAYTMPGNKKFRSASENHDSWHLAFQLFCIFKPAKIMRRTSSSAKRFHTSKAEVTPSQNKTHQRKANKPKHAS